MRLGHRAGFFGGEKIVYFFNNGKVDGYNWTISNKNQGTIGSTLNISTGHTNSDDGTGHGANDGGIDGSSITITVDVSKYNTLYVNITRQADGGVYIKSGTTNLATWNSAGLKTLDISTRSSITIELYTLRASAAYPVGERGKVVKDENYITVNLAYATKSSN